MFYIIPCAWRLKKAAWHSYGVWAVPAGSAWCNPWCEPISYVIICHIPNCCQTGSISMAFLMCKTVPKRKCLRVGKIFAFQICSTILTLWIGGVWNGRPSFIPLNFLTRLLLISVILPHIWDDVCGKPCTPLCRVWLPLFLRDGFC